MHACTHCVPVCFYYAQEHEERKKQMAKNAEAAKYSSGIDGFNTDDIVIGDDTTADEDGAIDIDQDWKADEL
jgi:hypothetical protein